MTVELHLIFETTDMETRSIHDSSCENEEVDQWCEMAEGENGDSFYVDEYHR